MSPTAVAARGGDSDPSQDQQMAAKLDPQRPVLHLPREILLEIVSYVPWSLNGQRQLASLCLVSRALYLTAVERLYHSPWITSRNFDAFVRTLCPSINLHVRRSGFGSLVRKLDMSSLGYDGSKSLTARLLGRVKENLEVFIAPAATFSLSCFAALSKCQKLRILNLSYVMDRVDLIQLLKSVSKMPNLRELYMRDGISRSPENAKDQPFGLPPKLEHLALNGHVCGGCAPIFHYWREATQPKLKSMQLSLICSTCYPYLREWQFARHLRRMELQDVSIGIGSFLFSDFPALIELSIDYASVALEMFTGAGRISPPHPLRVLTLTNPTAPRDRLRLPHSRILWGISDITKAVRGGGLSNLRQLNLVSDTWRDVLGARREDTHGDKVVELNDLMAAFAKKEKRERGDEYEEQETGIWLVE